MKLTHEDGYIVLRNKDGFIVWAEHIVDLEPSDPNYYEYPDVHFKGVITQKTPTGTEKTTVID